MHPLRDPRQLLGRRQPIRREILWLETGVKLLLQPGDTNLEELVQVRADDRQKLDPFQAGVGPIRRLLQHACIELEPAQFAIEVMLLGKDG